MKTQKGGGFLCRRIEHQPAQSFSGILYSCIVLITDQVLPDISEYDSLLLICTETWQEVEKQMSNIAWAPTPVYYLRFDSLPPKSKFFLGLALTEQCGFLLN